MLAFSCPCGKLLQAEEQYAGQETKCPACGRVVPIPNSAAPGPARSAMPPEAQSYASPGFPAGSTPQSSGLALWAMIVGILSPLCLGASGIIAVVLGILALVQIGKSNGMLLGQGKALAGLILGGLSLLVGPAVGIALLLPAAQKVREAAARTVVTNNMRQIGLAFHGYHDTNRMLPPQAIHHHTDGRPLLSWRVLILPYIEEGPLYKQFRLDEPWDGPHNRALLARMPKVFEHPGVMDAPAGSTHFQLLAGPGALYSGRFEQLTPFPPQSDPGRLNLRGSFPKYRLGNIPDGTSNTIFLVEGKNPVPWTKPEDVDYDPQRPTAGFGLNEYLVLVGVMDTTVQAVTPTSVSEQEWRSLISPADGNAVNINR